MITTGDIKDKYDVMGTVSVIVDDCRTDPDTMFRVAQDELKARAAAMDADSVIDMRQQIVESKEGGYVLMAYGTAVRIKTAQIQQEDKDAEYLRIRRPIWRSQGRCQYCGGFFKGGLKGTKVCSMCGMEKDY